MAMRPHACDSIALTGFETWCFLRLFLMSQPPDPERHENPSTRPDTRAALHYVNIALEISVEGQPKVNMSLRVEGEDTAIVAGTVSAAVSAALTTALGPTAAAKTTAAAPPASLGPVTVTPTATPAPAALETRAATKAQAALPQMRNAWLKKSSQWISAGFGAVLVLLAVLVPMITPPAQRGQVVIMTVLFGLTGALLLASAAMEAGERKPVRAMPTRADRGRIDAAREVARLSHLPGQRRRRAFVGLLLGLLFALAGVVAPFMLSEGSADPDARFLMVIGFSPVAISGGLLVVLFGRTLRGAASGLVRPGGRTVGAATSGTSMSSGADSGAKVIRGAEGKPESRPESQPESLSAMLATVGVLSGIVLTACGVGLPFVVNQATRADAATLAPVLGGLGVSLSLAGGLVLWKQGNAGSVAQRTPVQPKPSLRRAPVPRVPGGVLYKAIIPAVIVLLLVLIVVVILVVAAATVTPLMR